MVCFCFWRLNCFRFLIWVKDTTSAIFLRVLSISSSWLSLTLDKESRTVIFFPPTLIESLKPRFFPFSIHLKFLLWCLNMSKELLYTTIFIKKEGRWGEEEFLCCALCSWHCPFWKANDLLVPLAAVWTDASLTGDGWSGSIWLVQPGQKWCIQLHQRMTVINRVPWIA